MFKGDEIGAIFGYYMCTHTSGKRCLVNSVVSSRWFVRMGAKLGVHCEQTLTGFKWMGNKQYELEQEGFIEILPSRGFQLQAITPERIHKNNQVRSALEGYSALMLTQNRRTLKAREVIRHLGELLQRQEAISADRSALAEFVRWDSEFHLTIVESLENAELSKIFSSHLYCIQKLARKSLMHPGRMEATLREHREIYDAIRLGDEQNIYGITMRHMQTAAAINLAELAQGQTPPSAP